MEENSPILKEMASEPLGGKPLAFYSEIGPKSAIAWTQDEFCLFSAESGHSHSKVISFSNLVELTESSGAWTLSVREGQLTSSVTLSSQAAYRAKLAWTMDQLKRAREQACPSEPLIWKAKVRFDELTHPTHQSGVGQTQASGKLGGCLLMTLGLTFLTFSAVIPWWLPVAVFLLALSATKKR